MFFFQVGSLIMEKKQCFLFDKDRYNHEKIDPFCLLITGYNYGKKIN